MNRYRAVIQVPTVVEFENPGTDRHVTEQVNRIAAGMGFIESHHPRQHGDLYLCNVLECVRIDDTPKDGSNVINLADLTAPGAA